MREASGVLAIRKDLWAMKAVPVSFSDSLEFFVSCDDGIDH